VYKIFLNSCSRQQGVQYSCGVAQAENWICIGFNADPDQLYASMQKQIWIRIQGAKSMQIHADLDPG
jgi:hypothetical protein